MVCSCALRVSVLLNCRSYFSISLAVVGQYTLIEYLFKGRSVVAARAPGQLRYIFLSFERRLLVIVDTARVASSHHAVVQGTGSVEGGLARHCSVLCMCFMWLTAVYRLKE